MRDLLWALAAGAAIIALCVVIQAARTDPDGGSAAAWLAAFGTIAAFGAAIWVGHRPIAREERRRKEERASFLEALDWALKYDEGAADFQQVLQLQDEEPEKAAKLARRQVLFTRASQSAPMLFKLADVPAINWPSMLLYVYFQGMCSGIQVLRDLQLGTKGPLSEEMWILLKQGHFSYRAGRSGVVENVAKLLKNPDSWR